MIPFALRLANFMSYGPEPQTLSLADVSLAVLTGVNGAGKSALFDALTWAVWGRSRARSNDDVVRRGAEGTAVDFWFALGDESYHVRRAYTRRSGRHEASLSRVTPEGETPVAAGVRAVEQTLSRLLRLPYESFVASVYFKQGEAAYFTGLRPRDRKDIIFSLLGLDRLTAVGEKAKQAARVKGDELTRTAALAESKRDALGKLDAERRAAQAAAENYRRAEDLRAEATRRLEAVKEEYAALNARIQLLTERAARLTTAADELARFRKAARHTAERLAACEELLARAGDVRAGWQAAQRAQHRLTELERTAARLDELGRRYREVAARADERRRERERELAAAEERALLAGQRVARLEATAADVATLTAAAAELAKAEGRVEELRRAERDYWEQAAALAAAREELAREEAAARAELNALREAAAGGADVAARRQAAAADLAGHEAELTRRRAELAALQQRDRDATALEPDLSVARQEVARAEQLLAALHAQSAELGADTARCPSCGRPFDAASRAEARRHLAGEAEAANTRGREFARKAEELHTEITALRPAAEALTAAADAAAATESRRMELANAVKTLDQAAAEYATLTLKIAAAEERLRAVAASPLAEDIHRREVALAELAYEPEALAAAEKRLAALPDYRHLLATAHEAEAEIAAARDDQRRLEVARDEARRSLDGDFLTAEERGDLITLDAEREALAFDAAELATLREVVAEAPAAAARYRDVENAAAEAPRLREEAKRLSRDVAAREEEVARLAAEQAERPALETALAALAPRLQDSTATEREATRGVQGAAEAWGAAKREVTRLEREGVLLGELEAAVAASRRRLAVDEYLAEAFGPDGIPALMTERALAELEEEANAVLARLTAGRMTVQLATERERKAGGTTETLDVVIAEAGYPRPYESFSGGEAFRVDFALRLGLARLVARRAETPLRFLVVDEGFGTQDEEGMATLVEVIGEVREDFDKILVISHLPELRDRFPARVEVWRDARGQSRFRLAA